MADAAAAEAAAAAVALPIWAELGDVTLTATTDEALSAELELGSGRTNQNLIATANDGSGRRFFVRIGSDIPAYGVTRAKEQAAGRASAAAGIGPAVLFTSPDAMVTEFLTGKTLTDAELKAACAGTGDPTLLAEVAATLRKLHAAPAPPELGGASESAWAPADMWRWLVQAEEAGYDRLPLLADARELVTFLVNTRTRTTQPSPAQPHTARFSGPISAALS